MANQQDRDAPRERNRGVIRVILEQDAGFTTWLSDQFGSILKNFKQLETTMGKLEDYVTDIKAAQTETDEHIGAIKDDIATLQEKLDAIPSAGLSAEQEALLKDVADHAKAIAASVKAVDEINPPKPPVPTPDPAPAPATPAEPSSGGL